MTRIGSNVRHPRSRQRGVALVVALILLLVITMMGLAAIRGTTMQQHMSANLYDRELAFQNAEAAMRTAADVVKTDTTVIARNCQNGSTTCLTNPFEDANLPAGSIKTVTSGTGEGKYTAGDLAASQPQYVVEALGNWADPTTSTGYSQSANAHNYGAQGVSTTSAYYRITARSSDPATNGGRAVVTLQSVIKKG